MCRNCISCADRIPVDDLADDLANTRVSPDPLHYQPLAGDIKYFLLNHYSGFQPVEQEHALVSAMLPDLNLEEATAWACGSWGEVEQLGQSYSG